MHKWIPATALAALFVATAGCNSDSDNDDQPDNTPPPVTEAPPAEPATPASLALSLVGRYSSGVFDQSAAEIPAFDPVNSQIFIVNAQKGAVDVLDARDLANPALIRTLTVEDIAAGAVVNSVAYHDGMIAVAVEADTKTDNGFVALYDTTSFTLLDQVAVGAQPDMLTFTPDGKFVLVANEGEPSDDYSIDPEGSVSIVPVQNRALGSVITADFTAFNDQRQALTAAGVRIYGPGATVAQDIEPEYITVSPDSTTAWVALQENNALAQLDIVAGQITGVTPLGTKDHGDAANGIDASDEDGGIDIRSRPGVVGSYHPDSIAGYSVGGATYIVTANEGDARAWGEDNPLYWAGDASQGFVEEFRVKHLVHVDGFARRAGDALPPQLNALAAGALLNPQVFGYCEAVDGDPGACRDDGELGRLNISWVDGYRRDTNGEPVMFDASGTENPAGDRIMYDSLSSYGARSFSIWDANGDLVWDSADHFERYLASADCKVGSQRDIPCNAYFNSGHDEGDALDSRSDAKGPEPEGITIGVLGEKTFAFIGLERMGSIMVYDISNPQAPSFVDYFNTREEWISDPSANLSAAGDLGPEGLVFVPSDQSPSGEPLLIVGNEVSGTTAIYQINSLANPAE